MDKEEIENLKGNLEYMAEYEVDIVGEEHIKEALKHIDELEQKSEILDKVTEECRKQMKEYEDSILEIFPQKILNIIEGEKK